MKKEDLMKTLHDAGMADDEIKVLLEEVLNDINNAADTEEGRKADAEKRAEEEKAEKDEASRLLGVQL